MELHIRDARLRVMTSRCFRKGSSIHPGIKLMHSAFRARRRAGFTLVETIVTVGLLAVIAAFVIPTVIQKASSGDPVKVQNDLGAVRTALETFATDSKAGFPHQISSMTIRPIAGTSRLIDSTAMSTNQVTAWNGPYLG